MALSLEHQLKHISPICSLLFVAMIASCGNQNQEGSSIDAKPIDVYLEREDLKERPHLKIKASAFNKNFMLYGNFIPMLNSPTGYSLKGRIIRFQIFADRLVMLESPEGHSIANNNESTILLAEFPIVKTDDDGVVIDFAKGMNTAFTMRNVHSRSVSDADSGTAEQFKAILLSASFIKSIEAQDDILTIRQIAQWRNQKSELISAEFRYFLREYSPSPTFKKTTFGKNRWLQYFSTPPLVKAPTTQAFAYITKWDISKPITFYISSNTPEKYREAITDGLTFWNHIFGQEIVMVKTLENDIMAPHPRYNIVQWVPWDNEASAYADMVVDHLTGQTLQAQIYVRSGWVIQSAKKLRSQLEELLFAGQSPEIPSIEEDVPMPSMFDWDAPCLKSMNTYDALSDLATNMEMEKGEISDELLTLLTGDILRTVVAHEMGHVFGLRHNLAGSVSSTMPTADHTRQLKSYLKTGQYQLDHNYYLSSSIMDVFSAADDALMGAQIRNLLAIESITNSRIAHIYAHDKLAIDYGYFDKPISSDIPFCSDDEIPTYLDCRRWDVGNKPLIFSSTRLNNTMTQVAILLADTFATALNPQRNGGPLTIRDIPLTNAGVLKVVDQYVKDLFSWFNSKARSVQTEAQFAAFGPQNSAEINAARFKSMREQIDTKGVTKTLFSLLPPFRGEVLSETVLAELFLSQLTKRLSESSRSLNQDEREEAQKIATVFFRTLNQEVVKLILNILGKAQFDDPDFQLPIESALGKIAHEVILATNKNTTKDNELPQFTYDLKTRDSAAHILSPSLGLLPDWSFDDLNTITNELKQLMRKFALNGNKNIDLNSAPRDQRQWLLEQNRILNTLMTVRTSARPFNQPERK
jgi:hypothetical protein